MASEYLRQLAPAPPLEFARQYLIHYPRIGLGHFPPLLYGIEALWFLLFGVSKVSAHLMIGVFTAAVAWLTWRAASRAWGAAYGVAAALLWLSFFDVQLASVSIMVEPLVALLCFGAATAYAAYVESSRVRYGLLFGVLAGLGLLAKGTAIELALIPPLTVLLAGKPRLALSWKFWVPALVVAAIAAPWYVWSEMNIQSMGGIVHRATLLERKTGPLFRLALWLKIGGAPIAALATAGLIGTLARLRLKRPLSPEWAAYSALILAVTAGHMYLPESRETRHLFHATPVFALFALAGLRLLDERLPRGRAWRLAPFAALLGLMWAGKGLYLIKKPASGYPLAVDRLVEAVDLEGKAVLISSQGRGEGAFIAEMAMHHPKPAAVILRGTKSLALTTWTAESSKPYFTTEQEMRDYLASIPIAVVVLDDIDSRFNFEHHRLLRQVVENSPEDWRLWSDERGIKVYESTLADARIRTPIQLEMRRLRHSKVLTLEPLVQ